MNVAEEQSIEKLLNPAEVKRRSNGAELNKIETYTVEDAIEKMGFGAFQAKMAAIVGFAYMGDYAEMMLLSILSAALACEWHITQLEKATLTTVVFVGMMISGALWGKFCDTYGRKLGIWISTSLIFYYGFLSSFSPNFIWVLILRFLTGFAVGGVPQSFTLLSEFSPKKHRAKVFSLLSLFGPVGTCLTTALAILIMPLFGWRYLLVICSLPVFISSLSCYYLPESARFYIANGDRDKAIKVLDNVSKLNKKPLPTGQLIDVKSSRVKPGRFSDLFSKDHRLHTIILWMVWFTNSFSYYGIVLLTAEIFQVGNVCEVESASVLQANTPTCTSKCLTTSDYNDYFISSLAEFPAYFMTVLMVDKLGRLRTISITLFSFSLFTFLLNMCVARIYLTVFFTIARFFITITFQAIYVYTPEYYPTSIRALGMGTCGTVSRVGSILTAFISQVIYSMSPRLAICLYGTTAAVAGCLCFLLPETKGRELRDK